ncbi:hypothetical protein GF312_14520 [Candidatus Poribacteria bacterium]|nr:hypothetical protein [Candidatus Poribacteria bacterium]
MLDRLKELVEYAFDSVPLYRRIYGSKPSISNKENFNSLPAVTIGDFASCDIQDVISDMDDAGIILPTVQNKTIFPLPRLESSYDRDIRYEIFYYLINQADIPSGCRFLIITDNAHSYYCGEIVNNLLYYGYPAWMMILRDHKIDEVITWISRLDPDCLVLGLDYIPCWSTKSGVENLFTINQYNEDLSSTSLRHFDLYVLTELSWIGVRLPGENYIYPPDYFYIESVNSILSITALESWLQPFIRYMTMDRGQITGNGRLSVTYIGEH